jgi:hypothetical protein
VKWDGQEKEISIFKIPKGGTAKTLRRKVLMWGKPRMLELFLKGLCNGTRMDTDEADGRGFFMATKARIVLKRW